MICTIISDGSELDRNCRNEKEKPYPEIKGRLRETIWKLFCEGYTGYYVNCEYGIPLWTAEIITALKLYNDIDLNIVVPFEEQCRDWCEENRDRYYALHEKADNVVFACREFEEGCYDIAAEMMIDESDLAVIIGRSGSVDRLEKYAKRSGAAVRRIDAV